MKKRKYTINGVPYELEISSIDDSGAQVQVNGVSYAVEFEGRSTPSKSVSRPAVVKQPVVSSAPVSQSKPRTAAAAGTVTTPLPGVIVSVLVKEGDMVKVGQTLVVLEAMKMENSIDSDREGHVQSVQVSQGDSVMEGDVLVTIGE